MYADVPIFVILFCRLQYISFFDDFIFLAICPNLTTHFCMQRRRNNQKTHEKQISFIIYWRTNANENTTITFTIIISL